MGKRLIKLSSRLELRRQSDAWDDLWRRSAVTLPTMQAAQIELWQQTFAPQAALEAWAVEQDGQLVAALPVTHKRLRRLLTARTLPGNEWTPAGELLLDPAAGPEALDMLVDACTAGLSLLWLEPCAVSAPHWSDFLNACARRGGKTAAHERWEIPVVDTTGDWEAYRGTWSKNHRRHMRRDRARLAAEQGEPEFRLQVVDDARGVAALMQRGFEVENRSWKGVAGTSVLRSPGMLAFFTRQAELLAERGQLALAWLEVAGRPIAFEYGWLAKGSYHALKIGYDESFRRYGPGQLLMHDLLEHFFTSGRACRYDCMGPPGEETSRWETSRYTVGRVVVAPPGLWSEALLYAYRCWQPKALAETS